jgi:hypothetical protein
LDLGGDRAGGNSLQSDHRCGEAPKTWEEVLNPKWTSAVTVEVSNSRLQHVSWYELRQHSIRDDVPPPPGGLPINQLWLLLPEDWHAFLSSPPNSPVSGTD